MLYLETTATVYQIDLLKKDGQQDCPHVDHNQLELPLQYIHKTVPMQTTTSQNHLYNIYTRLSPCRPQPVRTTSTIYTQDCPHVDHNQLEAPLQYIHKTIPMQTTTSQNHLYNIYTRLSPCRPQPVRNTSTIYTQDCPMQTTTSQKHLYNIYTRLSPCRPQPVRTTSTIYTQDCPHVDHNQLEPPLQYIHKTVPMQTTTSQNHLYNIYTRLSPCRPQPVRTTSTIYTQDCPHVDHNQLEPPLHIYTQDCPHVDHNQLEPPLQYIHKTVPMQTTTSQNHLYNIYTRLSPCRPQPVRTTSTIYTQDCPHVDHNQLEPPLQYIHKTVPMQTTTSQNHHFPTTTSQNHLYNIYTRLSPCRPQPVRTTSTIYTQDCPHVDHNQLEPPLQYIHKTVPMQTTTSQNHLYNIYTRLSPCRPQPVRNTSTIYTQDCPHVDHNQLEPPLQYIHKTVPM